MRPMTTNLLKMEDLQKIHGFSMKLIAENGILFHGQRAITIFKEHGFKVEGNQVYFTEKQVKKALETCPSYFTIHGRDEQYNLELGRGKHFGVPGPVGPVNVTDMDQGSREGTLEDITNLSKIYQASDVINMNSNTSVEANDIDPKERHLRVQLEVLKHCTKPFYSKVLSYKQMHQVIDMTEIAMGGKGSLDGKIYMGVGSVPSLSPLAWDDNTTDCIIALAERGQLVTVGTGASTGITAPARVFGLLVMQNAELLSGIVLTQLVNPGNPVCYGTGSMAGNMRGAKYGSGSPTRMQIQVGTIEMGKNFYNLPSRTLCYGTDSTGLDIQAAIESYEGTIGGILSGADHMLSEIGTVDGLMTVSYEKTILDEEITSRILHLRKGIDTSDEAASMEVIKKIGSGGEFLTSTDTMANYNAEWYPTVTNWDIKKDIRPENDYSYVTRQANAEWKKRLNEAPESMLDEAIEAELLNYIEKTIVTG